MISLHNRSDKPKSPYEGKLKSKCICIYRLESHKYMYFKAYGYTSMSFYIFVKGNNFVDDLFVSLEVEALSKGAHF